MMTPASNTEVILAKVCPLLLVLTFDALLALTIGKLVFSLPLRGSMLVSFSPTSTMPSFVQWLSYLNPLRYFALGLSRGIAQRSGL